MNVWLEVYGADGNQRTGVIRNVKSLNLTRRLDGVGALKASLIGTDRRALGLLVHGARVRGYVSIDQQRREVGRGIVRRPATSDSPGGSSFTVDAPDELSELKDTSVLLGRTYGVGTPVQIGSVVDNLVSLANGWTADATGLDKLVSMRLDGASVLKGLQILAEQNGLHLRQAVGAKVVEFGAFGADIDLTLINSTHTSKQLQLNDDIALITEISVDSDSEDVVNRIYPVGGGEGLARINLANSTRSTPYAIQSVTGADGEPLRYIETGERPVREVVRRYEITPLANSAAAKQEADNSLYDAAAADLARSSVVQSTYNVTVAKCRKTVRPGDKVKIRFKGVIEDARGLYTYRDIDGDFWVLSVRENFNLSGQTVSMVVSNVDRQPMDSAEKLAQTVSKVQTRSYEVKNFPYTYANTWVDTVMRGGFFTNKPARFVVPVSDIVTSILRVLIRVKTYPLDSGTGLTSLRQGSTDLAVSTYSVQEHDYYPHNLSIKINGVDVTSALGGPWGSYTSSLDVQLDITDYIVNASGGLYQDHDIEFQAGVQPVVVRVNGPTADPPPVGWTILFPPDVESADSRGRVELSVQILGTAQAIL